MNENKYTDREKQCVICWKKIDKKKDTFVELRDYTNGKFESNCFYHLECWKKRFQISQEKITEQANHWMGQLTHAISGITNGGKSYEYIKQV